MPLRATDNPLVLPLLGLVVEQPRHQYAMLAGLRDRYHHLRVRTGSVYTLVGSLQEAGWIEQTHDDSTSAKSRPVAFRVTPAGAAEFRRRVVADLRATEPPNPTRFVTALAYIGILDRANAIATLRTRIDALKPRVEELEQAVETAGISAIFMVEAIFFASQTRHDIAWLEEFIVQIGDPGYAWPTDVTDQG